MYVLIAKYTKYLLFCLLFCCACGTSGVADRFSVPLFEPRYAHGFRILSSEEGDASTLIEITDPWQGADGVVQHIFVAREGEKTPDGFAGVTVKAPVRRVVCMSSSYVAMFDAIGCADCIAGVSGRKFISCKYVREHPDRVADVGYDTSLDMEKIVALDPDVVLIYGIAGENAALTDKFRELDIPYIYIGDYVEQTPLGKAEWITLAGELCDCRDRAEKYMDRESRMYDSLKNIAMQAEYKPSVILNTPYRDTWFMPSSQSYMVRLVEDAGGRHLYRNEGTVSMPVDMEQAYIMLSAADVWLNVSAASLGELMSDHPSIEELFRDRPLPEAWHNNRRATDAGGSDFWESGVVRPSDVLCDLIKILHPELSDGSETIYYSRLQ